MCVSKPKTLGFQSTPSVGRETVRTVMQLLGNGISIHSLRGEGDLTATEGAGFQPISIHSLRGEGDVDSAAALGHSPISIHSLRGEGDRPRTTRR